MTVVSVLSVAQWGWDAGFIDTDLVTIVAICGAESGYNDHAHYVTSREDSRGLSQINVRAHPWGRSINLYNGAVNLKAAYRVYREAGHRFTPWSTYNNGHYRNFWDLAVMAVRQVRPGAPSPVVTGTRPPPSDIPDDYSTNIRNIAGVFRRHGGSFSGWAGFVYRIYN